MEKLASNEKEKTDSRKEINPERRRILQRNEVEKEWRESCLVRKLRGGDVVLYSEWKKQGRDQFKPPPNEKLERVKKTSSREEE